MVAVRYYKDHAKQKAHAKTWVLLMDSYRAQIFQPDPDALAEPMLKPVNGAPLTVKPKAFEGDAPRIYQSVGMLRHALEPRQSRKEASRHELVRHVASVLHDAEAGGKFNQLILIAPKKVIGDLRLMLDGVKHTVIAEVEKDLTRVPLRALSLYLMEQHLL